MTRLEELTLALLDGPIGPAEEEELVRLRAQATPEAHAALRALLRVEAHLRGTGPLPDLAPAVLATVRTRSSEREERLVENVLAQVRRAPKEPRRKRHVGRWAIVALVVGGTAFAAIGVSLRPRPSTSVAVPAADSRDSSVRAVARSQPGVRPAPSTKQEQAAPDPAPLLLLDFETGETPPYLGSGVVVSGPPRAGSAYSAQGSLSEHGPKFTFVTVRLYSEPTVLRWGDDLVLTFQCWVGAGSRKVEVLVWNEDRRRNYGLEITDLPSERWSQVTVPFSALLPKRPGAPARPGDRLGNITLVGGALAGSAFFVDDIRVAAQPPRD